MKIAGRIKQGYYFDSVTLMRIGRELSGQPGVAEASVVMATQANKSILDMSGLLLAEFQKAGDQDLLIAVKAKDAQAAERALAHAEDLLSNRSKPQTKDNAAPRPRSLSAAVEALPGANLAMISVAGQYAAREARKALEKGLNVMLFSDNVSLEDELALKKEAHKKGLLVMGPDCGTAILNGIPLAFANVVPRGPIGVVGASGTGLQEVTCIIANEGSGITQAIGTGGRDVKDAIGGISFLDALQALADCPDTKVILLVSKPPQPKVLKKIYTQIRKTEKPVVALFIGEGGMPATLEQAAMLAVAHAKGLDRPPSKSASRAATKLAGRSRSHRRQAPKAQRTLSARPLQRRGLLRGIANHPRRHPPPHLLQRAHRRYSPAARLLQVHPQHAGGPRRGRIHRRTRPSHD